MNSARKSGGLPGSRDKASAAVSFPSPLVSDTATSGRTGICRSRMKACPTIPMKPMYSPKNRPQTMPAPSPDQNVGAEPITFGRSALRLLRWIHNVRPARLLFGSKRSWRRLG